MTTTTPAVPNALAQMQALAQQAAAVSQVDITETSTGGGERQVLETGKYLGRMVEYIEYGTQKNVFEPSKAPRPIARVGFALFPFEEVEGGGRRVSETPVFLRSFDLTISNHERAGLKKLYNRMNYAQDASKVHVASFLGEPFWIGVIKYQPKKPKDANDFRNKLDLNDITAPLDPMTGQPYTVPNVEDSAYKVFFWDMPTQETWDLLHIEGTWDDGKSKNFIQDQILSAVDFPGSALEQLLTGASSLPVPPTEAPAEAPVAPAPAAPADSAPWEDTPEAQAPVAPVAPVAPAIPAAPVAPAV